MHWHGCNAAVDVKQVKDEVVYQVSVFVCHCLIIFNLVTILIRLIRFELLEIRNECMSFVLQGEHRIFDRELWDWQDDAHLEWRAMCSRTETLSPEDNREKR